MSYLFQRYIINAPSVLILFSTVFLAQIILAILNFKNNGEAMRIGFKNRWNIDDAANKQGNILKMQRPDDT